MKYVYDPPVVQTPARPLCNRLAYKDPAGRPIQRAFDPVSVFPEDPTRELDWYFFADYFH